jgi:uncharacterized protein YcbK (DUF882 family)
MIDRRRFLATVAAGAPLVATGTASLGAPLEARALSFAHLHTGERLTLEYFSTGRYLPDALSAINHLLRDFRSGEAGSMDPSLLDVLHRLRQLTGSRQPFEIISGYRSATTNAELHRRSSGVATGSLHMSGRAIDIRLADIPLTRLRDAAMSLKAGGVGYYAASNFVHVDTGRVRAW